MQTFDNHQQVRPIDEMLERTLYVQAKNAEIERLRAENEALRERTIIRQYYHIEWQTPGGIWNPIEGKEGRIRFEEDEIQALWETAKKKRHLKKLPLRLVKVTLEVVERR